MEKIQEFIERVKENTSREFDLRFDKDIRHGNDEIIEDDGFLHRNFGNIRFVYYFGQEKRITKKDYKRFKEETEKAHEQFMEEFEYRKQNQ